MNVAIFYDAAAVAGRRRLLGRGQGLSVRPAGRQRARSIARFARAIELFDTPLGIFSTFVTESGAHKDALDLKKGGIFPLMHGVRALALERRLVETNTVQRIRRLQGLGVLRPGLGPAAGRRLQLPAGPAPRRPGWRRCACTSRSDNFIRARQDQQARARPAQGLAADRQAAQGGGAPPLPSGDVLSARCWSA